MAMNIFRKPTFKTKIIRGVFINQDLVVFPRGRMPDNLREAVKFLFGEGATVELDCTNNYDWINNHNGIKITGTNYVLDNVETFNADWICEEVEE